MSRVTVIGPRRRVDIVLPAQVPFAEQFAEVARFAGLDRAALAQSPEGWVLQRLGEPPFPPSATPAQAGLLDGELIYLLPRPAAMAAAEVSDDVADTIAGVHAGADRWTPRDARRVALGASVAFLLAGVAAIARSSMHPHAMAATAGLVAITLLAVAIGIARAGDDSGAGAALGWSALPYAFLAGLAISVPHDTASGTALARAGTPGLLAGFALMTLAAIVAATAIPHGLPVFGGVAVASGGGVAAALAASDAGIAGAAALAAATALALTPLIPAAAFRLARLRLPAVPASSEDLRDDMLAVPDDDTPERAHAADRYVTAAASTLGLLGAGAEIALALDRTALIAKATAVVLAGVLLLRARLFRGRAQRLWLIVPACSGLALIAAVSTANSVTLITLLSAAVIITGTGSWVATHRPSPFWGRAADITDTLAVIALLPLALAVAGVFGYLHGLG